MRTCESLMHIGTWSFFLVKMTRMNQYPKDKIPDGKKKSRDVKAVAADFIIIYIDY